MEAKLDRREELELFHCTEELEARALELALSIPLSRRGPLETQQKKTNGPLRELLREVIARLQSEDPCEISQKVCGLLKQADEIYWGVVLQWDRMALKCTWDKPDAEDLAQIARHGLYRACLRFDPDRGYRFSTYARSWMDQAISVYLAEEVPSIRVVRRDQESRSKLYQARLHLERELQREVSWDEAAKWVGMAGKEYERTIAAVLCASVPIDDPIEVGGEGSFTSMRESLVSDDEGPLERALQEETRQRIEAALSDLTEKEQRVLYKNLYSHDNLNYREIGEELGISRERVRQIRNQALCKLSSKKDLKD